MTTIARPRDPLFERLERQRNEALAAARKVTAGAEKRSLTIGEETKLEQHLGVAERAEARLARLRPGAGVAVRREPLTYEQGNGRSFFVDLVRTQLGSGDDAARGRLERHEREMSVELERRERATRTEFERLAAAGKWQTERRDLSRVDGAGGEFVMPLWLTDLFAPMARAGRVLADLARNIPLPRNTDVINIPRVTTGATAASQSADNAAVSNVDMVTNSIACPVRTITGASDVALQLLEQSPSLGVDEVLFIELLGDYNHQLASQLWNGAGTAGTILGVLQTSGFNTVTYTDATPTMPELQPKVADGASQAATARKLPPTAVLMAPRRWFWMTAAIDAQGRPIVPPSQTAPPPDRMDGLMGSMCGLPAYADSGIPLVLGGGTNEDRVVVARPEDHLLFESDPRLRVALDTSKIGTMGAKVTFHRYVAYTAALYPVGTSVVAGTGLVSPAF
jgi:HK97 family phage major capsid protein